jgi:hypothetical protein
MSFCSIEKVFPEITFSSGEELVAGAGAKA